MSIRTFFGISSKKVKPQTRPEFRALGSSLWVGLSMHRSKRNTFQTFLGVRHKEANTSRQERPRVTKELICTQYFENIGTGKKNRNVNMLDYTKKTKTSFVEENRLDILQGKGQTKVLVLDCKEKDKKGTLELPKYSFPPCCQSILATCPQCR